MRLMMSKFGPAALVGIAGWLSGSYYESQKQSAKSSTNFLPKLHAAQPIPEPSAPSGLTTARSPEIMRFGFPSFDTVRSYGDYVLAYDRRHRTAHWVVEHLTKDGLKDKSLVDRTTCQFQPDQSIHPFFRSTNDDYYKSGFDRGHLAAAGNHRRQQRDVDETFYLSNIAPQVGKGFNRDAWNKLEKYVRYLTKYYKNVYVCTGPLYLPRKEADGKMYVKYQVLGVNNVAVPTHFFKVVIGETDKGELDLESFVMPNAVINETDFRLSKFHVPLNIIERSAGLLIFDKIPRDKLRTINRTQSSFK